MLSQKTSQCESPEDRRIGGITPEMLAGNTATVLLRVSQERMTFVVSIGEISRGEISKPVAVIVPPDEYEAFKAFRSLRTSLAALNQ